MSGLLEYSSSEVMIDIVTWFSDKQYEFGSGIIILLVFWYVKVTFKKIQNMEYDIDRIYSSEELEKAKRSQYILYILAYFSGLLLLWKMLDFQFKIEILEIGIVVLIAIVVLAAGLYCLVFRLKKSLTLLKFFFVFVVLLMGYILYVSYKPFYLDGRWNQFLKLPLRDYVFITIISCSLSVFLTISIIFNTSLIRQKKLDIEVAKSAVVLGILCGLCYGVQACLLFVSHSLFHVLSLFTMTLITMCIIPYLQVWNMNSDGNRGLLDNYARSGVAQDGFLYGIIATANTIITVRISSDISQGKWEHVVIIFTAFVIVLHGLWNYCMQNNIRHLEKKQEEYKRIDIDSMIYEDQSLIKTQFGNLSLHLNLQNFMALAITLPYSIIYYMEVKVKPDC